MDTTTPLHRRSRATASCADPAARVTRSLAGYGVLAGPFYVVVSLVQAVRRDGFDLSRHSWSQLALGDFGWVQVGNLVVTGLMALALSVALRRTLVGVSGVPGVPGARGARAVPVLVGVFGAGLVIAGLFPADPAGGFPVGMPTPAAPTGHGTLHLVSSGLGFVALAAAMVVMALRYAAERRSGRVVWSVVAATALLGGFGTIASGSTIGVPAFTVGILVAFAWLSVLGADVYARATRATPVPAA